MKLVQGGVHRKHQLPSGIRQTLRKDVTEAEGGDGLSAAGGDRNTAMERKEKVVVGGDYFRAYPT